MTAAVPDRPTLAVVGATGAVGTVLLKVLSTRSDVWGDIRLLGSPRSVGRVLSVRGRDVEVGPLDDGAFDGVDVVVLATPADVSRELAPRAVAAGAVVVDGSEAFRCDDDVPLVVPEVNPAQVANRPRGIVANPHCTTVTLLDALAALHRRWGLTGLVVSAYLAASGAGRDGARRLADELEVVAGRDDLGQRSGDVRSLVGDKLGDARSPFAAPLALNVVPWVGGLDVDGWSRAERQVETETRKVLGLAELAVSVTCVDVPVMVGHALSVHATFEGDVALDEARQALVEASSVVLLDDPASGDWPTPVDVAGSDPTFVGRLRQPAHDRRALDLFVCGDNLRKGSALNSAQVAELVVTGTA